MNFQLHDFISLGNLLILLGIYGKLNRVLYQHKLMWQDFAQRKGISGNGKAAGAE